MSVDRFRIQKSRKIRTQSCDFTLQGPWTNETHCHFILSALMTPLWDENMPDSGYIKYIIIARPKPDCQLSIIYLLSFFFFFFFFAFHQIPFWSILGDHSSVRIIADQVVQIFYMTMKNIGVVHSDRYKSAGLGVMSSRQRNPKPVCSGIE